MWSFWSALSTLMTTFHFVAAFLVSHIVLFVFVKHVSIKDNLRDIFIVYYHNCWNFIRNIWHKKNPVYTKKHYIRKELILSSHKQHKSILCTGPAFMMKCYIRQPQQVIIKHTQISKQDPNTVKNTYKSISCYLHVYKESLAYLKKVQCIVEL